MKLSILEITLSAICVMLVAMLLSVNHQQAVQAQQWERTNELFTIVDAGNGARIAIDKTYGCEYVIDSKNGLSPRTLSNGIPVCDSTIDIMSANYVAGR